VGSSQGQILADMSAAAENASPVEAVDSVTRSVRLGIGGLDVG
jgi:hypothetical protein